MMEGFAKQARLFSPLGNTFPRNFADYCELRPTPSYGGCGSKGVFATTALKVGLYVGEYRGEVCSTNSNKCALQLERDLVLAYALQIDGQNKTILGHKKCKSAWTRYINAPHEGKAANIAPQPVRYRGEVRVLLEVARPIRRGGQLLMQYQYEA